MLKEKRIAIADRAGTLSFVVREMPARWREAWLLEAVSALATAGASVPCGTDIQALLRHFKEGGLTAIGNIDYARGKALLDRLFEAVSIVAEDGTEIPLTRDVADQRIQSVATLLTLRAEAAMLNIDRAPDGSLAVPVDAGAAQDAGVPIQ